ncbi:MAG: hypothetical protein M3Y71_07460 [Actinomycetota bacterium]|nr:hypothetical protein [Actinomycetota bacterium]
MAVATLAEDGVDHVATAGEADRVPAQVEVRRIVVVQVLRRHPLRHLF